MRFRHLFRPGTLPSLAVLALLARGGLRAAEPRPARQPVGEQPHSQAVAPAQLSALPAGLYLPVALGHTLKAQASRPGSPVEAYTTQRIPLTPGAYLPRGTTLRGTLVAAGSATGGTELTLRFTTLRYRGREVPVRIAALAIANFANVEDTYTPLGVTADPSDDTPANYTTRQIGGDVLTRSNWDGILDNTRTERVGYADFHGVYADPQTPETAHAAAAGAKPGTTPDPAGPDAPGARLPRALGVFSSSARGLYGFDEHDVLSNSAGDITITAPGRALLRANDNLLLEVY